MWSKAPSEPSVEVVSEPVVAAPQGQARPILGGPKLTNDQQRRVCELVAGFRTVAEVVAAIKEEFGVTISDSLVKWYKVSPVWKTFLQEARASFLSQLNAIPIANKSVRLDRLEQLYAKAMRQENLEAARRALVAAQAEMEGLKSDHIVYVNQQILQMDIPALEQRRREIAERLQTLEVGHGTRAGNGLGEAQSVG